MGLEIKPFNPDTPNYKVLNALRHEGTPDYQARVPKATQADIQASLKALQNYTPAWNEFVSAIINKVGATIARNNNWTNKLAKFKRGMLENGDTIEEIQTGLVQAYVYDFDRDYGEKALFGQERPEVQADYHRVNREVFYKITVKRVALLRAFNSPTGLAEFINQLMEAPTTSDNWDEYLTMRQLFPEYESNGGFFKVHVPEILENVDSRVQARQGLRTIRTMADKLEFLSRSYNAAHMPVHATKDQLELFITPEYNAALDVEAMATLFNVSYAEVPSRITVVDDLLIPGVVAILTTRDFFVVADTFYETASIPNPVGLHENFVLHHHQILSASRFVPAIAFTTGEGTIVSEIETPVTGVDDISLLDWTGAPVTQVERGKSYELAGLAVTTPTGGVNNAARFEIEGSTDSRTYATQTTLHVSAFDDAAKITLRITTVNDLEGETFTKTKDYNIVGDLATLWPNPSVTADADKDGLLEATPEPPTREGNVITIPTVTGVQYKKAGVAVNNGTTHTITATTVFTAEGRPAAGGKPGYEIAAGAPASWSFDTV